jgi:hypothetical protein
MPWEEERTLHTLLSDGIFQLHAIYLCTHIML